MFRLLSSGVRLWKDEKSKQLLLDLGVSLQQGNIRSEAPKKNDDAKSTKSKDDKVNQSQDLSQSQNLNQNLKPSIKKTGPDKEQILLNERENHMKNVKELYDSISHMSNNDFIIQHNFDNSPVFNSFDSEHFLDRKRLLKSIPDEIDIFNTPMDTIERTYKSLAQLDDDKSLHVKYYKRYLKKYDDQILNLHQDFNGITTKFKMLRRNELIRLNLSRDAFMFKENFFKHDYNVVGFDRSISGMPLYQDRNKVAKDAYPTEFIEDLQSGTTKIQVHKRDLDFLELDELTANIDPKRMKEYGSGITMHSSNSGGSSKQFNLDNTSNSMGEFDEVFNNIMQDNEKQVPKNAISLKSIKDYRVLDFRTDILLRIENEITFLRKSLQNEIELFMKANNQGSPRLLLYGHQDLLTNQYKLCEYSSSRAQRNSILIINYSFKDFGLLPNYTYLINSIKRRHNLKRHLFKLFLINVEDQVDTLIRIKYIRDRDMRKFMKTLSRNINQIIKFKLMKLFETFKPSRLNPLHNYGGKMIYDAYIFKPYKNNSFKRIYWVKHSIRRSNDLNKKSNLIVNWKSLDSISDR
ncbi:uncharacterized protein KQ657_000803 [Scheffersomyces spartinae]|uniref:Uncharacterized protein n=1 Tax=Scheffersomyces spartinae TaxID=45513 RepID=A0A9P7V983_9ASCO|nr:uncharacterized protein KQ657_000803 [Scheffersomyces spartinae]KAG7193385.1 hypothetical protein KQ657_000803 [Scheffersomyces spartinae]